MPDNTNSFIMKLKEINPHRIKNAAFAALDNFDNYRQEQLKEFFLEYGGCFQKKHWFTGEVTTHFRSEEEVIQIYDIEYLATLTVIEEAKIKILNIFRSAEIAIKLNCIMELEVDEIALIKNYID